MKEALRFYIDEARSVKGRIALLFVVEAFSATVIALLPLFIALLVDEISKGQWEFSDFLPLLCLIAALEIISRALTPAYFYAREKASISVEKKIAKRIFSHLTNRSLGFHADRLSGSLVSDADKTTRGFSDLIEFVSEGLFSNAVYFLVMIIAIASQAPELAPLFVLACAFLIIFGWRLRKTEADPSLRESESDSLVSAHLSDTLGNIETVIASGQREDELRFYDDRVSDWEVDARKLLRKQMRNSTLIWSAPLLIFLPLLFAGVYLVTNDHLSAGTLVLVLLDSQRIIGVANMTNMSFTRAIQSLTQAAPMIHILNEKVEIPDNTDRKIEVQSGAIEIRKVSFAYPEQEELLRDFSLDIASGERIGLVGPSGSGKSTLVRLLLRMIEPQTGEILVDGQDISLYTGDSLRQQISYVAQEPLLFHRTIKENIAYGSRASDEEIERAARAAYANYFIEELADGYNSKVGDRGVKLSGGERQRVVLARAFLRKTPILLLDEPTSALDSYSEDLIQQATERLFQDRTVLVIAHRLSTIAHLDRILVMRHGSIKEEGSHKDLLAQSGLYTDLWQKQSEGFLPEA